MAMVAIALEAPTDLLITNGEIGTVRWQLPAAYAQLSTGRHD